MAMHTSSNIIRDSLSLLNVYGPVWYVYLNNSFQFLKKYVQVKKCENTYNVVQKLKTYV